MNLTTLRQPLPRVTEPGTGCDTDRSVRVAIRSRQTPLRTPPIESEQRWRVPKPLVGMRTIEKLLNRHTAVSCPESRLVVAVIGQAIVDCLTPCSRPRRAARRFVLGDELGLWCDLVGLNADFVRFVARKAGYLADAPPPKKAAPAKALTRSPNKTCTPNTEGDSV